VLPGTALDAVPYVLGTKAYYNNISGGDFTSEVASVKNINLGYQNLIQNEGMVYAGDSIAIGDFNYYRTTTANRLTITGQVAAGTVAAPAGDQAIRIATWPSLDENYENYSVRIVGRNTATDNGGGLLWHFRHTGRQRQQVLLML